jgi:hypothetical protein
MLLLGTTLSVAWAGKVNISVVISVHPARWAWDKNVESRLRIEKSHSGNVLVVQVLRVVGLCKKEPTLCQQTHVLNHKRH